MTITEFPAAKKKDSGGAESSHNGAVTPERYAKAVEALKSHKSNTGATWPDIATGLGGQWSHSTIVTFASGKYPIENARNICEAVEQMMLIVEERQAIVTRAPFVETSLAKRMLALIKKAELLTKMAVVAAASGTGKTRTLQQYLLRHPRAVFFKANASFLVRQHATVWPITRKLMIAIAGHAPSCHRQAEVYDMIVDSLRGTGRPILIDEAQFLSSESLDLVRCVHEEADVPVILAGNETLYEHGPSGYSKASFVQFQSRTLRERFATGDIKRSDVDLIAEHLVGADVAADASEILLDQARQAGGFRRLVSVLQLAQTLRESRKKVTRAHVLAAIKELAGGEQ